MLINAALNLPLFYVHWLSDWFTFISSSTMCEAYIEKEKSARGARRESDLKRGKRIIRSAEKCRWRWMKAVNASLELLLRVSTAKISATMRLRSNLHLARMTLYHDFDLSLQICFITAWLLLLALIVVPAAMDRILLPLRGKVVSNYGVTGLRNNGVYDPTLKWHFHDRRCNMYDTLFIAFSKVRKIPL